MHEGEISVGSQVDKGATFTISLPIKEQSEAPVDKSANEVSSMRDLLRKRGLKPEDIESSV